VCVLIVYFQGHRAKRAKRAANPEPPPCPVRDGPEGAALLRAGGLTRTQRQGEDVVAEGEGGGNTLA
jgi:hypothetical protein